MVRVGKLRSHETAIPNLATGADTTINTASGRLPIPAHAGVLRSVNVSLGAGGVGPVNVFVAFTHGTAGDSQVFPLVNGTIRNAVGTDDSLRWDGLIPFDQDMGFVAIGTQNASGSTVQIKVLMVWEEP